MKPAVYNEIDPFCCEILRARINDGWLPPGDVDGRDIREVKGDDYKGYGQIHLFAGIGGFGYAARLAGLPDDFGILTGGFPCQPWSVAGKGTGCSDDRHVWPEMFRIIREVHPERVLGENVPGIDDKSYMALDQVLDDLESINYAVGPPLEIPSCANDSDHLRRRIWILAYSKRLGLKGPGACRPALHSAENPYREASGLVDAFQGKTLPYVCGRHDGVSEGVDRIKALGNAIDPHIAKKIMMCLV